MPQKRQPHTLPKITPTEQVALCTVYMGALSVGDGIWLQRKVKYDTVSAPSIFIGRINCIHFT